MSIYLIDIIDEIRDRLDDFGGDLGADGSLPYPWQDDANAPGLLWKNRQLVRYLAWAIRQIAERSPVKDSGTAAVCQIAVVAGTRAYKIHDSILSIEDVRLASTGRSIPKTTVQRLHHRYNGIDWTAQSGDVTDYLEDGQYRYLTLFPTPVVNDTLYLEVFRYYLDAPAWTDALSYETTLTTKLLEVPDSYRTALIAGACSQAWLKQDSDAINNAAAAQAKAEFDGLAGLPVDARVLESRRLNANLKMEVIKAPYVRFGNAPSNGRFDPFFNE